MAQVGFHLESQPMRKYMIAGLMLISTPALADQTLEIFLDSVTPLVIAF